MRRVHRKVRTGCSECRRRRVKCDERRPQCENCARNKLYCSLIFLTPSCTSSLASKTSSVSIQSQRSTSTAPFPLLRTNLNPSFMNNKSLELLHHYTTVVYISMSTRRNAEIFKVEIPRMGLGHPFVLHGTLAISALHLSQAIPSRREALAAIAAKEEALALPSFRDSVARRDNRDIHAIFGFAGMVFIYIMASTTSTTLYRIPIREDTDPHWFLAMRGLIPLLGNNYTTLQKGPFGPILLEPQLIRDTSINPNDSAYAALLPLLSSPSCTLSQERIDTCHHALQELRRVSCIPHEKTRNWLGIKSAVYIWPGVIQQEYLEAIYDREPEALVILAYFCVLVKQLDSCWYFKDLGMRLLENIEVELGREWVPWIQWAKDQPIA